jgi:predicted N-formylglutamate amidohydrolase
MYDPESDLLDRPEPPAPLAARMEEAAPAIELFNPRGQAPILIIADHAGRQIPHYLGDLGLPEEERARHIGWDIGSADMARRLALRLDAPAVLNHICRLVIDPNRDPRCPTSIPEISDGTYVPANQNLTEDERRRRLRLSFVPYHRLIARQIVRLRRTAGVPVIISMHSFTPVMRRQFRPWQVGVLWNGDDRLARPVLAGLQQDPSLCVGANLPYSGNYPGSFSVDFHAERRRLPNVAFEVRQDLIETRSAAEAWADRLAEVLRPALSDPTLYCRWGSWGPGTDADRTALADARARRRVSAG